MKALVWPLLLTPWSNVTAAEYTPYLQEFRVWETVTSRVVKMQFMLGVTNGYFLHRPEATSLYNCMSQKVGYVSGYSDGGQILLRSR